VGKDILLIALGAVISLTSVFFVEYRKRLRAENELRAHGRQLLKAIMEEVRMGIDRCAGLADGIDKGETGSVVISFSRVYTGLWDSTIPELTKSIQDLEILRLLDSIYYYFDLVNFNMNRAEFGIGAAFARSKLPHLKEDLSKLETKLAEIPE